MAGRVSTFEPKPESTAETEPEYTAYPEPNGAYPYSTVGISPEPEYSTDPQPEYSTYPEPEYSIHPEPEYSTTPEPEYSTYPEPEYPTHSEPEYSTYPEPEYSTYPEPEYSTYPQPEYSMYPEPEYTTYPEPEYSTYPEPEGAYPENITGSVTVPEYSTYPEPEGTYPENATGIFPKPLGEIFPEGEPKAMTISDPATMMTMSVISGIMASGIIIENLIVFYVLFKAWPKQSPTITYFIIHLACADLVSGLQFLWFNCIDVVLQMTHDGLWVLVLCGIWMVTIAASIGGIVNFAHLRWHALRSAIKHQRYSKRRAIICIALSWLLPILVLFVPPLAGWNCVYATQEQIQDGRDCSQVVYPFTKPYVLLVAVLLFTAAVWLCAVYICIFAVVHTRGQRLRAVRAISSHSKCKNTELQLFHTMVFLLSIFLICHLPVGIVLVFDYITAEGSAALVDAFQIILTISFINALLNPVIYYWRMPATRDSFWLAFGHRGKTQNKQQFSSATSISKKNEKMNTLTIVDIDSHRIDNKIHSTAM